MTDINGSLFTISRADEEDTHSNGAPMRTFNSSYIGGRILNAAFVLVKMAPAAG